MFIRADECSSGLLEQCRGLQVWSCMRTAQCDMVDKDRRNPNDVARG